MPAAAIALQSRLALIYALALGTLGALFPFLAFELQEAGLSGWRLAFALAAMPIVRLLAGPLWGVLADRFHAARGLLLLSAGGGVAATVLLVLAPAPLKGMAVAVLSLARSPLESLLDGLALSSLGGDSASYGRIRRWGSLGFLVAVFLAGLLRDGLGLSPLWFAVGLGGATFGLLLTLPSGEKPPPAPILPALRALAGRPAVRWMLLASSLHFISHAGATTFLAVHLGQLGHSSTLSGATMAFGVLVEVGVMSRPDLLFRRLTPMTVFVAAIALAVPRWLLNAIAHDPVAIVLIQGLHGFTFGAFWLAAVALMTRFAPPHIRMSGQGLLGVMIGGFGALGGMLLGSWTLEVGSSNQMFLGMAVVSALALPVSLLAAWHARRESP